jgi:transposase-like protein
VVLLQSGHWIANLERSLSPKFASKREIGPLSFDTLMTCKTCRIPMKELKGHIYHKQRKWKCPKCRRVRMQQPRPR